MFCPNCGTKNTETATTCTKCGFNIKGAAAPKFKGTMLMMNQEAKPQVPGAAAVPAAAQAAPAQAAPAQAAAAAPAPEAKPKPVFKGTMVGVAPPGGFLAAAPRSAAGAPAPSAAAPAAPAPSTSPFGSPGPAAAPAPMGAAPAGPQAFGAPPIAAAPAAPAPAGFGQAPHPPYGGGVNPLGGTVALPNAPAAYGLPVGGQYGGAPQGQQPGAPSPYGGPPQGPQPGAPMGAPGFPPPGGAPGFPPPGGAPGQPQAWGPPQPFGGPPPDTTMPSQGAAPPPGGPYAPQPQDPYGQQQGGYPMQQGYQQQGYQQQGYPQQGYGAMVPGVGAPLAPPGTRGKIRNPILCLFLPTLTCGVYGLIGPFLMLTELKTYLGKPEIVPWHLIIPIYNLYLLIVKVPEWVTEAKRRAGSRNPTSAGPLFYLLLGMYFLPKDLNEIWNPSA